MYHIKSDKRAQLSARLICEGLFECLKEKPFEKISITDIQKTAIVGRTTFYRLFDTTEDILAYLSDQVFATIIETKNAYPEKNVAKIMLSQWMSNDILLETIVNSKNTDILLNAHLRFQKDLREIILIDRKEDDPDLKFDIAILNSLMVAVLTAWIQNGKKENIKELHRKTGESLMAVSLLF